MAQDLKRCVICKQHWPLTHFNRKRASSDGKQPHCRDCNKAASKAYYRRSREKHLGEVQKNNVKYLARLREIKLAYLLEHPCVDCGERNPIVLEFDHVRGTKLNELARLLGYRAGPDRLMEEIAKCDVRCVNCHRRRTHRGGTWRTRINTTGPP
jgi:hypothetical protein